MGYYLNGERLAAKNKAEDLVRYYGATEIEEPDYFSDTPADKALVCVVQNGFFDAAALCYDAAEFRRVAKPDMLRRPSISPNIFDLNPTEQRPRTWLLMDKTLAFELAGYEGED